MIELQEWKLKGREEREGRSVVNVFVRIELGDRVPITIDRRAWSDCYETCC